MGKETRLFKSQERKNREEVSAFLTQLAGKISAGQVVFKKGQEEIKLNLTYNLVLEIQVEDELKKQKGVQHSLELEIKWFDDDSASGPLELG